MAQNNGLEPTQTYTSEADLNKAAANQKAGRSFSIPNGIPSPGLSGTATNVFGTSAGGDMITWSSNDSFSHIVPVKHGSDGIVNLPDTVSAQANNPTPTVAAAQQDGRIGLTGPIINSNAVGNLAIGGTTFVQTEAIESHSITGINYSGTGVLAVSTNAVPFVSFVGIYSGASASTGSYPLASVNASGAGWAPLGSAVTFKNGTYPSWSGAASAGFIPASGATFYADYFYASGTTVVAPTTRSITGLDNSLQPHYIPNVGNRFAR